jgi:hypothetical protein
MVEEEHEILDDPEAAEEDVEIHEYPNHRAAARNTEVEVLEDEPQDGMETDADSVVDSDGQTNHGNVAGATRLTSSVSSSFVFDNSHSHDGK